MSASCVVVYLPVEQVLASEDNEGKGEQTIRVCKWANGVSVQGFCEHRP